MNRELNAAEKSCLDRLSGKLCSLIAATESDDDTVAVHVSFLKDMLREANTLARGIVEKRDNRCPAHYRGDGYTTASCAMRSMMLPASRRGYSAMALWWWGCAFKYLWRWPLKGKADDLRKAKDCIDRLMDEEGWA